MPKNGYLDSSHPSYALRARSAGASRLRIRIPPLSSSAASTQDLLPRALGILRLSSRAQNPDSQRLRKRFFYARKQAFLLRMCTRHVRLTVVRRLQPRIYILARNPGFQRLRRRFFHAQKRVRRQSDTRHAQQ